MTRAAGSQASCAASIQNANGLAASSVRPKASRGSHVDGNLFGAALDCGPVYDIDVEARQPGGRPGGVRVGINLVVATGLVSHLGLSCRAARRPTVAKSFTVPGIHRIWVATQ
jgi:hypothetical protein